MEERTQQLVESNRELQESEYKFRTLSDATFEGIIISDKGKILEVNKAAPLMFGYSVSELVGKSAFTLISPEYQDDVKNKMLSGYEGLHEIIGLKKDGTAFPLEAHGKMLPFKGQHVRVTAVRDLTAKKKAEEEIKALRGIIPICSHCKEIRDDKGYWNKLEAYLHEHYDAEFSHSICPRCAKELYPDLNVYDD